MYKLCSRIDSISSYNNNIYKLDKPYKNCNYVKEEFDEAYNSGIVSFGNLNDLGNFIEELDDAFLEIDGNVDFEEGYQFSNKDILKSYPT